MVNTHSTLAQGVHSGASTCVHVHVNTKVETNHTRVSTSHKYFPDLRTLWFCYNLLWYFCVHSQEMRHDGGSIK